MTKLVYRLLIRAFLHLAAQIPFPQPNFKPTLDCALSTTTSKDPARFILALQNTRHQSIGIFHALNPDVDTCTNIID